MLLGRLAINHRLQQQLISCQSCSFVHSVHENVSTFLADITVLLCCDARDLNDDYNNKNNNNRIQRRYSRFFTISSQRRGLQHVRSSGPGAIVCKSRATHRTLITCKCHVTCHLVQRDSSAIKFDRVEIAFI